MSYEAWHRFISGTKMKTEAEAIESLAKLIRSGVKENIAWNDLHEAARDWYRYQAKWLVINAKEVIELLNESHAD